jgi:hypothetical protein
VGRAQDPSGPGDPGSTRRGRAADAPRYTGFERFHDDSEAPYYRSERRRLSPEQTWSAIKDKLVRLLDGLAGEAASGRIDITPDRIHRWHRFLFSEDFYSGGDVRRLPTQYPVRLETPDGFRVRMQSGTDSAGVTRELAGCLRRLLRRRGGA